MAKSATMRSLSATPEESGDAIPEWARTQTDAPEPTAPEPVAGQVESKRPAMEALVAWLESMCDVDDDDTSAGLESIIRQTLEAPDMAAVLRQTLPQSGQNFIDTPMLWTGFRILPSEYEDGGGAPFYASLQVLVGEPPEPRVINCGGWRLLAQVMRAYDADEWPQVVMIVEAAKAKGKKAAPLMLVRVDANGNPITG